MSFLRKQESISFGNYWTPAFAGVTNWELLGVPLRLRRPCLPAGRRFVFRLRRLASDLNPMTLIETILLTITQQLSNKNPVIIH